MTNNILRNYLLLDDDYMLGECDFHLKGDELNKNHLSSSIPITLKEVTDGIVKKEEFFQPHLILFYFNDDTEILKKWEKVLERKDTWSGITFNLEGISDPVTVPKINFKGVNLDFEKRIYDNFKNISTFNPFYWTRLHEKSYFILFYNNTFPIEFYKDEITSDSIKSKYYSDEDNNWLVNFSVDVNYLNELKNNKFKVFDEKTFKGNYYQALEDNKPVPGIIKGKHYQVIKIGKDRFKFIEI